MNDFAVLPAPQGYQLIEIDDNYGDGDIDRWLSNPEPVLGFLIRKQEVYFSVLPITASGVHDQDGLGGYALIRPDGKVDYDHGFDDHTFDSIDGLKVHLLREAAQLNREMATEKDVDRKDAAEWRRHARKLEEEASRIEMR